MADRTKDVPDEVYARVIKEAGIRDGIAADLGCGSGRLIKELHKAAPGLVVMGVDTGTNECGANLRSAGIGFVGTDDMKKLSKQLKKDAGGLGAGVCLLQKDYYQLPAHFRGFFDCSFLLFPTVNNPNISKGAEEDVKRNTALFLIELLRKVVLASDVTKEGGKVVIALLTDADIQKGFGRSGIMDVVKETKLVLGSGQISVIVGKPKRIDGALRERINQLNAVNNRRFITQAQQKLLENSWPFFNEVLGWFREAIIFGKA